MNDSSFSDEMITLVDTFWSSFDNGPPAVRVSAMTLLVKILTNIVANPSETKYLRLNEAKVAPKLHGGATIIKELGFVPVALEPGFLVLDESLRGRVPVVLAMLEQRRARGKGDEREGRAAAIDKLAAKATGEAQRAKLKAAPFKSAQKTTAPAAHIDTAKSLADEDARKRSALEKTQVLSLQREIAVVQQSLDEVLPLILCPIPTNHAQLVRRFCNTLATHL
jgi:hypothetical protein